MKGLAGEQSLRAFEKHILLRILDDKWKEHLSIMDHLRQGIHLCSYAAKNPKQEYKQEAFELLSQMLFEIKHKAIANKILHVVAVAIFNKQGDLLIAQRPKRTDLYRTCLSRKNNSARVWIIKDFHGEAHGRERQAVRWIAPNMLEQFDFPEANHGITEALSIQKMYSGNIVIHPTF